MKKKLCKQISQDLRFPPLVIVAPSLFRHICCFIKREFGPVIYSRAVVGRDLWLFIKKKSELSFL